MFRRYWLTLKFLIRRIFEIPTKGFPSLRRPPADSEFDKVRGVDTARRVQITVTDSANLVHGTRYEASTEASVRWAIENCGTELPDAAFIDVGCGKGRPMMIAAEYPFRAIEGVEYAPELASVCRCNLTRLGIDDRCTVVTADAVDYRFPDGDLLVFLYNPFSSIVYSKVLDHLAELGGKVRIAHCGPGREPLEESPFIREIAKGPDATRLYEIVRSS